MSTLPRLTMLAPLLLLASAAAAQDPKQPGGATNAVSVDATTPSDAASASTSADATTTSSSDQPSGAANLPPVPLCTRAIRDRCVNTDKGRQTPR